MRTGATAPVFSTGIRSRLVSCPGHFTMRKEPAERKLLSLLRTKDFTVLQYKKGKVSKNYLLDYNELYTGL